MESKIESDIQNDIQRYPYDLGSWSHMVGKIGHLQTLKSIPIVAGDSFELDARFQFKLSPMVRSLAQDCFVDLFAFYVPYRHVYGSNWTSFVTSGYDEAVTLGTLSTGAGIGIGCVGRRIGGSSTVPTWLIYGYQRIWNRYFKHPADADYADNYLLSTTSNERYYGIACCHKKAIWNTGMANNLASADRQYTVAGSVVDLPDFAIQKARLKTELERDWFAIRYKDLLEHDFGGDSSYDGDQRADLLTRTSTFLSGWDVEGTDTASIGSYTGRAAGIATISFPRRFFPEHGTLWIMALLRFPPVAATEIHYLSTKSEPTYAQIMGDPTIVSNSEPVSVTTADFFQDGSSTVLNRIPHSQWYRYEPSTVHVDFTTMTGHPFYPSAPSSTSQGYYLTSDTYDAMFANTNLGHWHCSGYVDLQALRAVPPPRDSIYAGSRNT